MSHVASAIAGYSTHEVARLLGLTPSQVRAFVRDGLLEPQRGARGAFRFSFHDLLLLKKARRLLTARISSHRVHRALRRLRRQLRGENLPTVELSAVGRRIVARRDGELWEPETGQRRLDFAVARPAPSAAVSETPVPFVRPERPRPEELEADAWYSRGRELEEDAPERALEAYRRAVELDPEHADAHLDLGRLLHEGDDSEGAEPHYRRAMALRPDDMVAAFNLGVALQDLERPEEAIAAYHQALEADPRCADAHYNLSGLYEGQGNELGALRHLKSYRALTRR